MILINNRGSATQTCKVLKLDKFILISAVFFACVFVINAADDCTYCPSNGYAFEKHLSAKTPYRIVSNKSMAVINYAGCKPHKIWMIVRHGTRNPGDALIEAMKTRLPIIKQLVLESTHLPNEFIKNRDLDLFRKWKPIKLGPEDSKKLTHEGEEEMVLLAERMQSRFPSIFDSAYSNSSYKFKHTLSQRTKKSALYFAAGLFGRRTVGDVWFPAATKEDIILRFYKMCKKWVKDVKGRLKYTGEQKKFEKGVEMNNVVLEVNERLNLKKEQQLDSDDILLLYLSCAFETAWSQRFKSPWCSLFTIDNFQVLEYNEDLKYYWKDGYSYPVTYTQACVTFEDIISFLACEDNLPKTSVYFTHSGTMLKLIAHLGLYKDDSHLTNRNFREKSNRKWKTSKIDAFGSNLAFVLFRCGPSSKILTMHQEHIIRLPSCPDEDLCDIVKIRKYYEKSLEECNFHKICENEQKEHEQLQLD